MDRSKVQTLSISRSLERGIWVMERNAAESIMGRLRSYPVELDHLTRGEGDCMVIALLQQCRRPQVVPILPPRIKSLASQETITADSIDVFRLAIWDYVRTSKDPKIEEMKENFRSSNQPPITWDSHWEKLIKQGEWGDEIFLQCTAIHLGVNILIFSTSSVEKNPFTHLKGTEDPSRPDFIVGYTGDHYQSLLPSDPSQLRLSPVPSSQKVSSSSKSSSVSAGPVGAFFAPGTSVKLTAAEKKKEAARERQRQSRAKRKAEGSLQAKPRARLTDAEKRENERVKKADYRARKRGEDPEKFKANRSAEIAKTRAAHRDTDEEVFKANQSASKAKTRAAHREADEEVFKAKRSAEIAKTRAALREADSVGVKERHNKEQDKYRTKQRNKDYEKHKSDQNQHTAKSRAQRRKKLGTDRTEPGLPAAKQKKQETSEDRENSFKMATMTGADYICCSCQMKHFRHSVVLLTKDLEAEIDSIMLPDCPWIVDRNLLTKVSVEWSRNLKVPPVYKNSDKYCGQRFICSTCKRYLKSKKLPPSSVMNNLQLQETDQQLKEQNLWLTALEANLVSPRVCFQMVQLLPGTRWTKFKNQNIMVPIPAENINETLSQLPRMPVEGSLIGVHFKRKKELRGSHMKQYVDPAKLFKFVKKMMDYNNPHFSGIVCDSSPEDYKARVSANDQRGHFLIYGDDDIEEDLEALPCGDLHDGIVPDEDKEQEEREDEEEKLQELNDKEDFDEEVDYLTNDPVKKYQFPSYDATSCLIDNFPEVTVAPGEGQKPMNMRSDKNWDVKTFPHLYNPDGSGGKDQERRVRLTDQRFFMQRILNKELRFSQSPAYLYACVGYLEQQRISGNIALSGRRGKKVESGGRISYQLDDPTRVLEKIKNTPAYWKTMKYELLAKLDNLGPFHLFFTLSCADTRWKTNFASILMDLGHEVNHKCESVNGVLQVNIEVRTKEGVWVPMDEFINNHLDITRHELVRQSVLSATRYFDHRVKQFLKKIVLSKNNPMLVKHYSYKVEFQARGAAHIHGVLWLDLTSIERNILGVERDEFTHGLDAVFHKLRVDEDLNESDTRCLANFIDAFVTVSTHAGTVGEDVARIALEVQKHHHTKTCRKLGSVCRFNYPKPPSPFTIIQVPVKNTEEDRKKFLKLQEVLKAVLFESQKEGVVDDIMSGFSKDSEAPGDDYQGKRIERIKLLCARVKVSYDDYLEALKYSKRGYNYVLARDIDETNINPFNPEWLRSWDANMDVQPTLDFFQVITYISNYYSKCDNGVTKAIMSALKDKDCADVKEAFKLVANTYTRSREINECEAAYRLIPSLFLSSSNIRCKFAVTGLKEQRSNMFRQATEKHLSLGVECVQLEGREGLWYEQPDLWSKYLRRPDKLKDICFAQFVKMYDSFNSKDDTEEDKDEVEDEPEDTPVDPELEELVQELLVVGDEDFNKWHHVMTFENNGSRGVELPLIIELKDPIPGEARLLKRRQQPACLRFHKVRQGKDSTAFMVNELMLYSPMTEELQPDSIFDIYTQKVKEVEIVKSQVMEYLESVEEARIMLAEAEQEMDKFLAETAAALDPQGEQDNDECEEEGVIDHPDFLHINPDLLDKETDENQKASSPFIRIEVQTSDLPDLHEKIARLDLYQSEVVNIALKYARDLVKSRKPGNLPPVPPLLMCHGGAGAGKSTVINIVARLVTYTLSKAGDDLDQPYVLKAAFTGTAASNIEGNTLSSMFSLCFSNNSGSYHSMSTKKLDTRRVELSNLKLLIIDEVSMLKADMLYEIEARLQEITRKFDKPFGGVSLMCFGDLMQLKPVGGRWIFESPMNRTQFLPKFKTDSRWAMFSCVILEKNHRQGKDLVYAEVLNRIRVGQQTPEDIDLLLTRVRQPGDPVLQSADLRIGSKRKFVAKSNAKYIRNLPGDLMILQARHDLPTRKKYTPRVDPVSGVVAGTPFQQIVEIKLNSKIIMIHNVDTSDCLTNGQLGCLTGVIKTSSGDDIDKLVVKFNNSQVGKKWRQRNPALAAKYPDCVVLSRTRHVYTLTKRGSEGASATMYQFPLMVANAITAHKIQGQTIPFPQTVVIDMVDMLHNSAAIAYVMLSRVQRLDQIYFEGGLNQDKITMDHRALEETQRLKDISWNLNPGPWMSQDSKALKIASLNVSSLGKHIKFMSNDEKLLMADVLHFQETWLHDNDIRDVSISPSHKGHFVNVGKGKGVASYTVNTNISQAKIHREGNFQVLKLTVRGVDLINVYRSEGGSKSELINVLSSMLDDTKPTLISGDFNICTLDNPDNKVTKTLKQMDFDLVIREATHILGGHLDHAYWRDPEGMWGVPIVERYSPYYTDHDSLLITLSPSLRSSVTPGK